MGHGFFHSPNFLGLAILGSRCRPDGDQVFVEGGEATNPKDQVAGHDGGGNGPFRVGAPKNGKRPKLFARLGGQAGETEPPIGENQFMLAHRRGEHAGGGVSQSFACPGHLPSDRPGLAIQSIVGSASFFLIIGYDQQILSLIHI